MENYNKMKAIKRKIFHFDVTSIQRKPNLLKFLSFRKDVAKPAAVQKDKVISLTNFHHSSYESLVKKGVAFIPNCIDISYDTYA